MPSLISPIAPRVIPQQVVLAVLDRCDETREFMMQMWLQNPHLAKQGEAKVAAMLSPLPPLFDPPSV